MKTNPVRLRPTVVAASLSRGTDRTEIVLETVSGRHVHETALSLGQARVLRWQLEMLLDAAK